MSDEDEPHILVEGRHTWGERFRHAVGRGREVTSTAVRPVAERVSDVLPDVELDRARAELAEAASLARAQGSRALREPIEVARDLATHTKTMHEELAEAERRGRVKTWFLKQVGKGASRLVIGGTLEAPIFFGYGVGDVIALGNAAIGRDAYTGFGRIDTLDRAIYFIGAIVPGIPASVFVEGADLVRFGFESIFARDPSDSKEPHQIDHPRDMR